MISFAALAAVAPLRPRPRATARAWNGWSPSSGSIGDAEDRLRVLRGDLLDVHAALRGGHDDRLPLGAVEGDRDVQLLGDVGGLLDEDLADELPLGAGLVGDELHAEDLARRAARASSGDLASLTPPPLPRPPAWIWALTTHRPPSSSQIFAASSALSVTLPLGVATPYRRRISLA